MSTKSIENLRNYFPGLDCGWILMDNAGGAQVCRQVGERFSDYLYNSNVQLGGDYPLSQEASNRQAAVRKEWSRWLGVSSPESIVLGSSTTQLIGNMVLSIAQTLSPGDEVVVSTSGHEANIGPWMRLQKAGIKIVHWKTNRQSWRLEPEDLGRLLTERTRWVAFEHVSNILGTINPVEEITEHAHQAGARVCVDGVAYAPHILPEPEKWNTDLYCFSLYKVFGPHQALLYGNPELLRRLPGINHFFITDDDVPYKFQPGNVNYELAWASLGITDYFKSLSDDWNLTAGQLFSELRMHENHLAGMLLDFLRSKQNTEVIGLEESTPETRVPTISFTVKGARSADITRITDQYRIAIRWGDFYARRLINDLALDEMGGVVRVSMVHYNTENEVERLIGILEQKI
ncbi:MAG: cysteine desulfurase-like protein [Bacteroidales bacterium]